MMLIFFREGGWSMFLILGFGITSLISAGRYAFRGGPTPPGFLLGMSVATLFVTLAGVCSNVKAVFHYISSDAFRGDRVQTLFEGLDESVNACIMGFMFLAVTALVSAYGASRAAA